MEQTPLVLVVEGDLVTRSALSRHLKMRGFGVLTAKNGTAALKAALAQQPAILLVDWQVPGMDGVTLCRRIKAEADTSACYCILMAACIEEAMHEGLDESIDDYLSKPHTLTELDLRLRNGVRLIEARDCLKAASLELEINMAAMAVSKAEAEEAKERLEETAEQLMEIAAQLQAEIYHNAEQESEHIRQAKMNMVVQAAATLRHEINNPLFAISGNAESAMKRLRRLAASGVAESEEIAVRIERILIGAERIGQVVQAFSHTVNPITTDYLPGIPMLALPEKKE